MIGSKVSIIIPTHNRASLLSRAVRSAFLAGDSVEVIVVDDASTDDTSTVCAGLSDIRYIRLPRNRGLSAARNAGIQASSRPFIALLDDDDLRLPDSLAAQVALLEAHPAAALVYGQVALATDESCTPSEETWPRTCPAGDVFWKLLEVNFIPVTSVLIRRECLLEKGLFNTSQHLIEDWDMWIRLSETWTFLALEQRVAVYKTPAANSNQLGSQYTKMRLACAQVQARGLSLPRAQAAPKSQRTLVRHRHLQRLWYELLITGLNDLLECNRTFTRQKLGAALRLLPRATLHWECFWLVVKVCVFSKGNLSTPDTKNIKRCRKDLYVGLRQLEASILQ